MESHGRSLRLVETPSPMAFARVGDGGHICPLYLIEDFREHLHDVHLAPAKILLVERRGGFDVSPQQLVR